MFQQTLIIILTVGQKDFLSRNLEALRKQTCRDFDLLVIDNAPEPEIKDLVKSYFPSAEYAAMRKNLNRAGSFSWGINYAVMRNYHYLWFMADDTATAPETLELFEQHAEKLAGRFSFFAPLILDETQKPCVRNAYEVDKNALADYENIRCGLVRAASFSCTSCFINIYAARHAGLPYREFVCGAEDLEYAKRLLTIEPGYFIAGCVVNHLSSCSRTELTNCPEPRIEWEAMMLRNKTWLYQGTLEWGPWENYLNNLKKRVRKGGERSTRRKRMKALRAAIRDGLRMKPVLIKTYSDDYESLYSPENIRRILAQKKVFYWRYDNFLAKLLRRMRGYAKRHHDEGHWTPFYPPFRCIAKLMETCTDMLFERGAARRRRGWSDPRFARLRSMKNAYAGKRCFVCATGPSMTIADLEKLKGEYTLGVNSICMIYPQTDWRPSFYGISDRLVYKKLKSLIETHGILTFVGTNAFERSNALPPDWILFPENYAYHAYSTAFENRYWGRFSEDCYAAVYDCYTIVLNMIQILFYMGFKEIYLLGCDCSYTVGAKNHFIENGHVIPDNELKTAYDRLMAGYHALKDFVDAHPDLKVFNSTRGGMLELFPRKSLEDVLAEPAISGSIQNNTTNI